MPLPVQHSTASTVHVSLVRAKGLEQGYPQGVRESIPGGSRDVSESQN